MKLEAWTELDRAWRKDQGKSGPTELRFLAASEVEFISEDTVPPGDYFKRLLETYSGQAWIWWPFEAPRPEIPAGNERVQWKCSCGQTFWLDAPEGLIARYKEYLKIREVYTPGETGNQLSSPGTTQSSANNGVFSATFCHQHDRLPPRLENSGDNSLPPLFHGSANSPSVSGVCIWSNFHILFAAFRGDDLRFDQIDINLSSDDNAFIDAVRRHHRRMIGEVRYWSHPRVFHSCSFARYTRTASDRLAKHLAPELPLGTDYQYDPKPVKGDPYSAPISEHEWYDHFHKTRYRAGCRCALRRIPKRNRPFVFFPHTGREDMWGLFAELRISFFRVLIWFLIIILFGWIFLAWWLAIRDSDLQNAAVPVTLIVMALASLWMPPREHLDRKF